MLFGAFQRERFYRAVEPASGGWRRNADAVVVFADFAARGAPRDGPAEIPIDARGRARQRVGGGRRRARLRRVPARLGAARPDGAGDPGDRDRRFEAIWTLDARAARRAARTAARLTAAVDPVLGGRIDALLADRPLALDQPAPALTALANRVVAYLEP